MKTDSSRASTPAAQVAAARERWIAAVLAALASVLVKLPQLRFAHREPDEVIYWQLAQRLWQDGVYSLRGTRVLPLLPAEMYDHALFHHPPLLPLLLGPWAASSSAPYPPGGSLWVVWLAHALGVAAVVALGLRIAQGPVGRASCALAAAALVFDPLGWFCARFLWIDALSFGCAAGALWAGIGVARPRRLLLAGVLAGLAGLAKLTGLVVLPFLLLAAWPSSNKPLRALLCVTTPAVLLVGAWTAYFWNVTGAPLPTWIAPSDAVLARDELMRRGFERSPWLYPWLAASVQPLLVWTLAAALASRRELGRGARALAACCVLGTAAIGATSLLGTTPVQLRQLAPVAPAFYALALVLLVQRREALWRWSFAACVLAAGLGAALSVHGRSIYEARALWQR